MAPTLRTLNKSNIEIEANPRRITPLPKHAEELRQLLLNFKHILPKQKKIDLKKLCLTDEHLVRGDVQPADNIFFDSLHPTYEARWQAASNLRDMAKHLGTRHKESQRNALMTNFVFHDINQQSSEGSDELFTNAVPIRGQLSDKEDHRPKPDLWFGLGIYGDQRLSRLQGLEKSGKAVDHFTQDNLRCLSRDHPNGFLHLPSKSNKDAGFPWMVVEFKKELGDQQEALRQAANDSYTSYRLGERLAAKGHLPVSPIVAFTSVGPKVKIFIMYKDRRAIYRMACIWSGNVEHILHAVQLRRIVDQLMFWALRIFKPWVTECLEHWYTETTGSETDAETDASNSSDESAEDDEDSEDGE